MTSLHLSGFCSGKTEQGIRLSCTVRDEQSERELVYDIASSAPDLRAPDCADWALVGLLFPAMIRGCNIVVDAPVSRELLYNVNNDIQALFRNWRKNLKPMKVTASSTYSSFETQGRMVTAFSGGVDSFATLVLNEKGAGATDITGLTLFDVGAFGKNDGRNDAIKERSKNRLKKVAEQTGRHWFTVDTNLDDFFQGLRQSSFARTCALRNASAALALQSNIDVYGYSASIDYNSRIIDRTDFSSHEPILLPLLSTPQLRLVSTGASLQRFEKTREISNYELAFDNLDVCCGPPEARSRLANCSACEKCNMTLVSLDLLGCLDNFQHCFDLDLYRENRDVAVKGIYAGAHASEAQKQLRDLIKGTDLEPKLSLGDRLQHLKTKMKAWVKSL